MIEKLTRSQIVRFPEFVDRWTRIGLCTDPADRPAAEHGIRTAYQIAGMREPTRIVWCGSPMSQALTRAIVFGITENAESKVRDSVWASVRDSVGASVGASVWDSVGASVWASVGASVWASVGASVWDSVWDSVGASVRASVGASVRDSVWASVRDSVRASVGASVRASVRDSVWDSVRDSVWASVWDSVRDSVGASVYGQHEAGWLAFQEFFREACGLSEQTQKLCGILEVAKNANWWLPHEKICWISDRHNVLNRDDRGRLHCDDGPALAYPDGWKIFSWHGVRLDEQIIMRPETQTIEQINDESNEEIKRIRIERLGWRRYLKTIGAEVIDSRRNDVECTREALMRAGTMKILVCHCPSTGKVFSMECDSQVQTCQAAQNFLWSGSRLAQRMDKLNLIGRS